jgi:hypothetical protein
LSDAAKMRELRMEMLRMRANVERAEAASAMRELRGSTDRLRSFGGVAGSIGAALVGGSGWAGLLASLVRRPWVATFALGAVRSLKRRPLLAAVVVAAAVVGLRFARSSSRDAT